MSGKRRETSRAVACAVTTVLIATLAPQPFTQAQAAPLHQAYIPFLQSSSAAWRLTTSALPGAESQPNVSPDGKTVIILQTTPGGQTDIYAVPFGQGEPVNLTHSPDVLEDTPRFSPDGSEILFARQVPGATWDIYTMTLSGTQLTRVLTDEVSSTFNEVHPFVAQARDAGHPSLRILYSSDDSGNWAINEFGPERYPSLTNNPAAANRFPSLSPDGTTVLFRSEQNGNSDLYMLDYAFPRQSLSQTLRVFAPHPAFDLYPSFIPDGSGVVFDSFRSGALHSHVANLAGDAPTDLGTASAVMRDSAFSADSRWQVYAGGPSPTQTHLFVREFESPLYQIGERGKAMLSAGKCDWEAQTLAMAWAMSGAMTHDARYIDWTREFVDACKPARTDFEINDGLIGYAALMVYRHTGETAYLTYARSIADWILNTAQRSADGTLLHIQNEDIVWCDTLLGITPLLTEMTRVTGDLRYLNEAAQQVILHAKHLQDPATGLYHHAWRESQPGYFGPAYWARGNGWAAFGNALVRAAVAGTAVSGTPIQATLDEIIEKHTNALMRVQDESGRWHTLLDHPDSYLETSGSGLISFAWGVMRHCGLAPAVPTPLLRKANLAVWQQVAADGTVQEIQGPTGPLGVEDLYHVLPYSQPQLYGQAIGMLNSLRTNDHVCG